MPRVKFVFPPPPIGACCVDGTCYGPESEAACLARPGGVYLGNGTTCTPNPCMGACCYGTGSHTLLHGCSPLHRTGRHVAFRHGLQRDVLVPALE